jgi:hypothetical protein
MSRNVFVNSGSLKFVQTIFVGLHVLDVRHHPLALLAVTVDQRDLAPPHFHA